MRSVAVLLVFAACSDPARGSGDEADGTTGGGLSDNGTVLLGDGETPGPGLDSTAPGVDVPDGEPGSPEVVAVLDGFVSGACEPGQIGCLEEKLAAICAAGTWQPGLVCTGDKFCLGGYCALPGACTPGVASGCDGLESRLVCTADGKAITPEPCPGAQLCAEGECKDVACVPGVAACTDFTNYAVCKTDGSGYADEQSCGAGSTCTGGHCLSQCELSIKFTSNVGCEYWSVDLDNDPIHNPALPFQLTPEMFPHSVVITNPNDGEVKVTFAIQSRCADGSDCSPTKATCNNKEETICGTKAIAPYDLPVGNATIPAGETREFKMPVMNVSGSSLSAKAIRIRASLPVVAHQFNPFNSENAASNDGSLLLPQDGLGKRYFAVSLPSRGAIPFFNFPPNHGFLTVVAASLGTTTVTVTPRADLIANPAGGVPQDGSNPTALAKGTPYTFTMHPFEVLNLSQKPIDKALAFGEIPLDLTGTLIEADQPIAVFGGHQVAGVSDSIKAQFTDEWDTCCTEHMEEQLMPVETWGTTAYCTKSKPRGYEIDEWVVVAGEDNVALTTEPSIDKLDGVVLAKAGDHVRVETTESFTLTASGPVEVIQFLVSGGQTQPKNSGTFGTGDPTMMLIPPPSQYRDHYVIQTADGYSDNWTTVIRPAGLAVTVDGAVIPSGSFEPFGDGTWEFAYQSVEKGTHTFKAEGDFGLMVYGYGTVTAYGYPGGMNLAK